MGIAGELRAKFEEVDKSARLAALSPIGAIDQPAQFADVREHFGNRSLLRQASRPTGREAVELPEKLLRASQGFGNLLARHLRARHRKRDQVTHLSGSCA
jgi:hypothetical protein